MNFRISNDLNNIYEKQNNYVKRTFAIPIDGVPIEIVPSGTIFDNIVINFYNTNGTNVPSIERYRVADLTEADFTFNTFSGNVGYMVANESSYSLTSVTPMSLPFRLQKDSTGAFEDRGTFDVITTRR